LFRKSSKIAAIPQPLLSTRTGESVPLYSSRKLSSAFLWRADTQSGFNDSIRRMQCDHKPMIRRRALTLVRFWKPRSALPTSPFLDSSGLRQSGSYRLVAWCEQRPRQPQTSMRK